MVRLQAQTEKMEFRYFDEAEFIAVATVSLVRLDKIQISNHFQIFLVVAIVGGFLVTECGRKKSKSYSTVDQEPFLIIIVFERKVLVQIKTHFSIL